MECLGLCVEDELSEPRPHSESGQSSRRNCCWNRFEVGLYRVYSEGVQGSTQMPILDLADEVCN